MTLSLKKSSFTKFNKIFTNGVDAIMEKLGKDGYEESSQGNKSDKEDDSESEKEQPTPRKIIRAKKSATAASQPGAEESKSQVRPQRKPRAAKTAAAKKAKDESESEDMDGAEMSSSPKIG